MASEWKNIGNWRRRGASGTELCFSNPLASFLSISANTKPCHCFRILVCDFWVFVCCMIRDLAFPLLPVEWETRFLMSALPSSSLWYLLMSGINLRAGRQQSCIHPAACSCSHWYLLPHLQGTAKLWHSGAEVFECYNTHIWKTDKYAQILLPCCTVSALHS